MGLSRSVELLTEDGGETGETGEGGKRVFGLREKLPAVGLKLLAEGECEGGNPKRA